MKFSDALDRNLEDIQRPPVLPIGHYVWQVQKHPDIEEFESQKNGKTYERVTFNAVCVSATEDVDPDELEEYGNVQGALNRKTFMFSNDPEDKNSFETSLTQLKRFLGHCGIEDEAMPLPEALAASVGAQFVGEVKHRPDPNDTEVIYAEIGRTTKA